MTAPEPLTTTLEELAVLHGLVVWKDPTSEAWVAGRIRRISPHDPAHYSHAWEPMGIGATWPEAASDALHRPVVARDEAAELRAALAEMSDLVFTVLSAEEELGRINVTAEDYPEQDYRAIRDEALVELETLAGKHDDRAALAASERQS